MVDVVTIHFIFAVYPAIGSYPERAGEERIELSYSALEAEVLPLNDSPIERDMGIEPISILWKRIVVPIN